MTQMKQVIIIRRDLWMRRGKEIAQGAHASLGAVLEHATAEDIDAWMSTGNKKVVCKVQSERDLLLIEHQAREAGLPVYLVRDAGATAVAANTATALAIGPAPETMVDRITGELELY